MPCRPRPRHVLRGRSRAGIVLALGAGLLGGCVTNGDFGRVRPELVREDMHDWLGRDALAGTGRPPSEFRTTDQERELRDRAYALIEPPYNRGRWDSVWREYGRGRPGRDAPSVDRGAYLARLAQQHRRSETSAYAQIATDARNDVERLPAFFAAAARVSDMDGRRAQAMAHVVGLDPLDRANALARNRENAAIIRWVCSALGDRVLGYRYALERVAVAAPNPAAADADRAIGLLARDVAQYCRGDGRIVRARG